MWGRDYVTVLSEGDAKWMLQIGVTNNSPDLTICAGCVLELTRQALVQAGVLEEEVQKDLLNRFHSHDGEHYPVLGRGWYCAICLPSHEAEQLRKALDDEPTDPNPGEHPHLHEMFTTSDVQATGPNFHPGDSTPGGRSVDGKFHFHHGFRYDTFPTEDSCIHCNVWPLCGPR